MVGQQLYQASRSLQNYEVKIVAEGGGKRAKVTGESVIKKPMRGWVNSINEMVNSVLFCSNLKSCFTLNTYLNKYYIVPEGF